MRILFHRTLCSRAVKRPGTEGELHKICSASGNDQGMYGVLVTLRKMQALLLQFQAFHKRTM